MDVSLIWSWLLSRESGYVLSWWLLVTLAGAAVWPLLFRILGGLPDRGYTLARAAGLMLTGFLFWFLGSLGLLENTPGGMVFAWGLVLVAGIAALVNWDGRPAFGSWVREHRGLLILTEVLFLVLLFGWAVFRAHNPEMRSTEKPMEIMFLNSIRTSTSFPPHDAWLSGYAISYYYFGYVIMAMLADLSSASSGLAFNITNALVFALTGIGALGIVYNLVRARGGRARPALGAGLLGLTFLAVMGNLGTALVEFPYHGYTPGLVNAAYFDFWDVEGRPGTITTLDADGNEIKRAVDNDNDTVPDWDDDPLALADWSFQYGVGWRYSRTLHDRDLDGAPIGVQPIAEFPMFSFMLADNHPHVLALPFALLAIGLALNLVLNRRNLLRWEYPLYAIWVGGMVFMNSWDAIYLPILIGAEVLRRLMRRGDGTLSWEDILGVAKFVMAVLGLALVCYLPWLISFTSQASGILPNLIFPTQWQQFFLQFGPFLVILTVFLAVEWRRGGVRFHWQAGLLALTVAVGTVSFLAVAMGLSAWGRDDVRYAVFQVWDASGGLGELVPDVLRRRLVGLPSELLMFGFVFAVVARLFARRPPGSVATVDMDEREIGPDLVVRIRAMDFSPATAFALFLVGAGAVLTVAPDFVYLRDNFAVRINTVFKLYYQGWIMFSLASAFAVWSVIEGPEAVTTAAPRRKRKIKYLPPDFDTIALRFLFAAGVVILLGAGLLYPLTAGPGRIFKDTDRALIKDQQAACEETGYCPELPPLVLDGASTMITAEEYAAVECLADLEKSGEAVILEAPCNCGYHPEIGRFSALTGIPTLLGWANHQHQWRGPTYPEVTDFRIENGQRRDRMTDAQELYTTQDWERVWYVIDRYDIDYIVVGAAERNLVADMAREESARELDSESREILRQQLLRQYTQGLAKFEQVLEPVCGVDTSTVVYRVAPE